MSEITTYDLGRIGLNIRGAYDASTNYEKLDVVYYNFSSYVAKRNTTGVLPGENEDWTILAQGENNTLEQAEHLTGKIWIDGKPIYRQVLTLAAITANGGSSNLQLPNPTSYYDKIIELRGFTIPGPGDYFQRHLPHYDSSTYYIIFDINTQGVKPNIRVLCGSGSKMPNGGYAVVEYTKA